MGVIKRELWPNGTVLLAKHLDTVSLAKVVNRQIVALSGPEEFIGQTFQSPSAAARALTGYSTNGWLLWTPIETAFVEAMERALS